jgi:capsular polysaccharide biosynthesis protein
VELRAYWTIIWRRIWIIALVVGVVALYVGYQYYHLRKTPGALTAYRSDITIQVGLQASPNETNTSPADNATISENLADALTSSPVLTSREFDSQVSQQIGADMSLITQKYGTGVDLGDWRNAVAIGGALSVVHTHNLVTISATWNNAAGAWAIANAVGEVSSSHLCQYLGYGYIIPQKSACAATTNSIQPVVSAQVISNANEPAPVPGSSVNKLTLLFILLFIALIVGLALAFLADYLDDRIYNKETAANLLQLPILGEVPRAPNLGRTRLKLAKA